MGRDPKTHLAVLKINPGACPAARPDGINVGDWVVATGNPYAPAIASPPAS
jgi:S1-C subfamily serine protease